MDHIFNLSYDLSAELADKNQVKPEDRLTRETFMQVLVDESVIDVNYIFIIGDKESPSGYHRVLNPVKTTIVFKSNKTRAEIVKILSRYSGQLHYVITEVQEDEDLYLGSMHENAQEQKSCDDIVKKIVEG